MEYKIKENKTTHTLAGNEGIDQRAVGDTAAALQTSHLG